MKRRFFLLSLAALALFALLLIGCGTSDDENGGGGTNIPSGPGVGETVGVTDTEITIATLLPMSNTSAAAWGVPLSQGMKAYYDYINDQGGIYGRKINFIVGDSEYTGPVANEAIRRLVENNNIFGLQGSLGTAAHSAVYKYLEEKGVPDMYVLTGNTKWTEPIARTRFGFLVDYITEGRILGQYIGKNFDGKKLGILAQNDDFGKEGEKGLKTGVDDVGANMEVVVEYYDETQNDVTAQMQRLKNANVDVVGFYGMPVQASSGIKVARETLSWDVPFVITGTDAVEVVAKLTGFDNLEGTVSVVFAHQAFETSWPGVERHRELMAKYAPGVAVDNLTLVGWGVSEAMADNLRQAGPDLTRSGFIDAAESTCDWTSSTAMVPASMSPTDHRPIEAEVYVKATVDRSTDPPTFRWEPFGDVISFESTESCTAPTPPPDFDKQPH